MPTKEYKPSPRLRKDFLNAVRQSPGIRTDALAEELSVKDSTVSALGRLLLDQGCIVRKRNGHYYHYHLPEAPSEPADIKLMIPSDMLPADIVELAELDAIREELESLRAEVKDLRAFKERAFALHPELDVEPIVLEARKIAYRVLFEAGNRDGADSVLSGHADDTAIVKATVEALRRAAGAE